MLLDALQTQGLLISLNPIGTAFPPGTAGVFMVTEGQKRGWVVSKTGMA